MLIRLAKSGHRDTTIYYYDPCTDSILKRRILHENFNKLTNWEYVVSEYGLTMCRKAVQIIGQETQKNTKNIEANGTEDNSSEYTLFICWDRDWGIDSASVCLQDNQGIQREKLVRLVPVHLSMCPEQKPDPHRSPPQCWGQRTIYSV